VCHNPAVSRALQRHLSITKRAGATAWLRPFISCSRPQAFALALQHRIRHFGNITLRTRCNACETELDSDHWDAQALGCAQRKGYNVTHRHNRIRAAIARVFREHGTDVQEEVKVTDDLRMNLVIFQDNNREMWVDLTVFTTDSKSNLKKAVEDLDSKARYSTEPNAKTPSSQRCRSTFTEGSAVTLRRSSRASARLPTSEREGREREREITPTSLSEQRSMPSKLEMA
jgi:hypothetical protein